MEREQPPALPAPNGRHPQAPDLAPRASYERSRKAGSCRISGERRGELQGLVRLEVALYCSVMNVDLAGCLEVEMLPMP